MRINDGARYNPATDTWSPMATNGAPSARHGHTAVWTGTEMIVWGGQSDQPIASTFFGDGARYNPVTDTWLPLPNSGSPGARAGHTAVWTGSEMAVWGGNSGTTWLNTGGRYLRASDSWSVVPTSGAPAPRQGHTAVWTGSEMIVFGGYNTRDNGKLTAGYEPCPLCVAEAAERRVCERLHKQGVPSNLLRATLDNWIPATGDEGDALKLIKEFATQKRGFLVLLGGYGTGKSHLAVGVMRNFRNALFVKQNTLLRQLRETYRSRAAADPVDQCQDASLLVLDEAGLSAGGRDELPMLHEILDFRHGEMRPTVITGNLDWNTLAAGIGERLADRFKESDFRVIQLAGQSHRTECRERYFPKLKYTA